MKRIFGAAAILLAFAAPAQALPKLQLGITDGFFFEGVEADGAKHQTTLTMDDVFTVNAYLTDSTYLGDTFILSTAIVPKTGPAHEDLGSFTINGTTVAATGDMTYGVPPLEAMIATKDGHDLAPHSVFETFFIETLLTFNAADEVGACNVQEDAGCAGQDPTTAGGTGMYFVQFDIDATFLKTGFDLHFDLYNTQMSNQMGDLLDVDLFAPFSKDGGTMLVPEPTSLALMGFGILVLGFAARRWSRRPV